MNNFVNACRNRYPVERKFMPLPETSSPRFNPDPVVASEKTKSNSEQKSLRTVLLTDEIHKDGNLSKMIDVFLDAYLHPVEVIDINQFPYEVV